MPISRISTGTLHLHPNRNLSLLGYEKQET